MMMKICHVKEVKFKDFALRKNIIKKMVAEKKTKILLLDTIRLFFIF